MKYSAPYAGGDLTAADLDCDGKPDLVVPNGNQFAPNIMVLMGKGDGSFQPPSFNTVGPPETHVVVVDLNNDGHGDLVGASSYGFDVLLGNGDGTFQPASSTLNNAFWPAAGDVNGDGNQDLAFHVGPATANVLLGAGDGTFAAPITVALGIYGNSVELADMNGDGKLDIFAWGASGGGPSLAVALGNGDGSFQSPWIGGPSGLAFSAAALGDVNVDGKLDVFASPNVLNPVSDGYLFPGNGSGQVSAPTLYGIGGQGKVAIGDLNRDGYPEVVVANHKAGSITILVGAKTAPLSFQTTINVGGHPEGIVLSDLDGDGKPDIVATDSASGSLYVLMNTGQ